MDAREKAPATPRARKDDAASGRVPAGNTGGVVDGAVEAPAAEPAARADGPRAPTVFGEEASEFALLLKQGEQTWLLTSDDGNHEFARVFWMDPKKEGQPRYILRDGGARLGKSELLHIAVDNDGAHLTWSGGRYSQIPRDWYQLTWK